MHVYRKDSGWVRFRCSGYPSCRNYEKLKMSEYEQLLSIFTGDSDNPGTTNKED
jgi:hypothetical protein